MMFGMGKSNAKIYVKSSEGIRFSDVAVKMKLRKIFRKSLNIFMTPGNIKR